jgi:hypothetical protein
MPKTHGFGGIENKLTGRPTRDIQRFRVILSDTAKFCTKAEAFRA